MRCSRRSAKRRCDACPVKAGDRVLDVGCGCGDTTLRLAARGATATGVDISKPMLARARERAAANGLAATFMLGDAAETRFDTDIRPAVLAFRRDVLRRSDRGVHESAWRAARGGRLCFVCWQPPQLNPWISVPFAVAQPMLPPQPALEPRAPGPFAFAEPDYVREILTGAGFKSIIDRSALRRRSSSAATSIPRCEMVCEVGPLSRSLAGVDPVDPLAHRRCRARTAAGQPDEGRRCARRRVLDRAGGLTHCR